MKNLNLFYSVSLSVFFFYLGMQIFTAVQDDAPQGSELPFYEFGDLQWYKMKADAQLTADQLVQQHSRDIGLGPNDRWVNFKTETDEIGMTHHRYQMYHEAFPVKGAILLIHEKDGSVQTFNGKWPRDLQVTGSATFSENVALEKGLEVTPATKYQWEDPSAEHLHQHVHRDEEATFYPHPELVYFNPQYSRDGEVYQLAYKMTIHAQEPMFAKDVYIDASTGELLFSLDVLCSTDTPATCETKYHGTRTIITDSIAPDSFVLRETGRGFGIETYRRNGDADDPIINGNGVEMNNVSHFVDTDNYWNNVNADQDEVAGDAHYSAEMTFDFFDQLLGHTGVDGDSMALVNIVHHGNNLVNAFWNGSWATYGDGNNSWSPLTSLDVVGHEFTHGVTGNTAGLIYMNEMGALNESFSDIFGTAIEFWGDTATADYFIGEDFDLGGNGFRNMMNPNAEGNPDTYQGNDWEFTGFDNGGVHINSGVQNYWYYLLSEGGSGTNDNNYTYQVDSISQNTASFIAFRNLRYYLVETSEFIDARFGSEHAATDLYGDCSFEVIQVKNAWKAVGVGPLSDFGDLELLRIIDPVSVTCGLSANEFPVLEFTYHGCEASIDASVGIPLAIQVNNGPIVRDTVELTQAFESGDTLVYTYTKPIDGLQGIGIHDLVAWVDLDLDPFDGNNTKFITVDNVFDQNSDFQSKKIVEPRSDCFMTTAPVEINIAFGGCDSIEAGETLNLFYTLDGSNLVSESTVLTQTYYRDDVFSYTFQAPIDLTSELGLHDVEAWVKFPSDFVIFNDSISAKVTNPVLMNLNNVITFENGVASEDSFYLNATDYSSGFFSDLADFTGEWGYRVVGGDVDEAYENDLLEEPIHNDSFSNVWEVNEVLSTKLCCCVNGTAMTSIQLSLDFRQRYGFFFIANEGIDVPETSSMRILINDEQISPTYIPLTHIFDTWQQLAFDISDYAGQVFEVCFESRNFTSPETDDVGDIAQYDNILISSVVSTQDPVANVSNLELLPNPTNGIVNLIYQTTNANQYQIEVLDVHGRVLQKQQTSSHIGTNQINLDVSNLSQGVYYVRLSDGVGQLVEPLVKL